MTDLDLDHVMLRIGRILTADSTLDVTVRGTQAYAKPGHVVLPAVETYDSLGADAERVLHGVADHEFGHAADTDFEAMAAAGEAHGEAFHALLNSLEDGYVERRRITLYPGAAHNLKVLHDWFAKHSVADRLADPEGNLWEQFCLAVAVDASPVNDLERFEVRPEVLELVERARPLYEGLDELRNESKQTAAVVDMAKAVWDEVKPPDPPPEEEPEPEEDEDSEEQQDQEQEGDEDDEEDEDEEDDQDEEDQEQNEDEEDGDEDEEDEEPGEDIERGADLDPEGEEEEIRASLEDFEAGEHGPMGASDAVGAALSQALADDDRGYEVFDPAFDLTRDFSGEYTDALSAAYKKDEAAADDIADELVAAFEARLQSMTRQRLTFDGAGPDGVVDAALLPGFSIGAVGSDDLWLDYTAEVQGGHAAVAVMIDCSGSMAQSSIPGQFPSGAVRRVGRQVYVNPAAPGSKAYLARLCAIAITKALTRCQVPHEVTGFTTLRSDMIEEHPWTEPAKMRGFFHEHFRKLRAICVEAHNRGVNLHDFARTVLKHPRKGKEHPKDATLSVPFHAIFKGFAFDDARALELIAGICENLDGESVLWQARRLARRPERRKVMFVLSDGMPAGSNDDTAAEYYLQRTIKRVMEAGIEVYGIGIMSGAVRQFYPRSWVCKRLADLPDVVMRALTETVVEGSQRWDKL